MPTYTYLCESCGKEYEIEQRISDPPIAKCSKCGKNKAHRVITNGNFILKGGGWYSDGYSSKHTSNGSSAKNETKTKNDASDAKSAAPAASSNDAMSKGNSTKGSSTSVSAV